MNISPPNGSEIKIVSDRGYDKIIVPHGTGGVMRYFVGAYLVAWLGGWSVGWMSAFRGLTQSNNPAANGFLLFWIAGWTVGGFFAAFMLYRIFRRSVPESYLITPNGIEYDTGCESFKVSFDVRSQQEMMKRLFQKQKSYTLSIEELRSLKLREHESGNRLTVDKGSTRLNLAPNATEIEKEWLYDLLSAYCTVEQTL